MRELSLHILDLVENAVAAGATHVSIEIAEWPDRDTLCLMVADNGRGMSAEAAARATDPYSTTRTTREVGLGLALLEAAARQAGGDVEVRSTPGRGTTVSARFQLAHVDRAPLGSIEDTLAAVAALHPAVAVTLRHAAPLGWYQVVLGGPAREKACNHGERARIAAVVRRGRQSIGSVA